MSNELSDKRTRLTTSIVSEALENYEKRNGKIKENVN